MKDLRGKSRFDERRISVQQRCVAAGCLGIGAMVEANQSGVRRIFLPSTADVWAMFYLGPAISLSPIELAIGARSA